MACSVVRRALERLHDLDQLHLVDGIEEVHPGDARRARASDPAISVMLSAEVFVAMTACRRRQPLDVGQQRQLQIDAFRRCFDDEVGVRPARRRGRVVVDSRRSIAVGVRRRRPCPSSTPLLIDRLDRRPPLVERRRPRRRTGCVSYPPAIAACAIPCPIVPAPSTAIRRIFIRSCRRRRRDRSASGRDRDAPRRAPPSHGRSSSACCRSAAPCGCRRRAGSRR